MKKMCVYPIDNAPYLAVGNVYKEKNDKCLVKDTRGRTRKVAPFYVGPFDATKLCMFGALVSNYFQSDSRMRNETVIKKSCELFGIDLSIAM